MIANTVTGLFISTPLAVIGCGIAITIWYALKGCYQLIQRIRKAIG